MRTDLIAVEQESRSSGTRVAALQSFSVREAGGGVKLRPPADFCRAEEKQIFPLCGRMTMGE